MILHFLKILEFENAHSLCKLIFKVNQLQKIPEYDIFQKTIFFTLASRMNLGLNTVPVAARVYEEISLLFTKNLSILGFQCIFKQVKAKRKIFRQCWANYL